MAHIFSMGSDKMRIAKTNLFLISEINKRLEIKKFSKENDTKCIVLVISKEYDYCPESINIIEKYYSRDNWTCRNTKYYKVNKKGLFCYAFTFTKNSLLV